MALTPGTRLGVYEILTLLGSGGMGEVYRAKDTKLGRDVAIKVLPETFKHDPDRVARFKREAQVLASLNHPHIAAIHGLDEADGCHFLILELVDGEDLSQRIARGAIPVEDALPIVKQVAEALEAAHEQGIIHRDLKPANIKVRPDGAVKVLDFGLAKALEPAVGAGVSVTMSPTITTPAMTQMGMLLGTAAYMSPAQAQGRLADKRSDIWAFGCLLYEMLTGRIAFPGETVTDTLVAVLERQPDWRALPATLPPAIKRLLQRCLEKDAKRRLHDIADARIELEDESQERTLPLEPKGRSGSQPLPRSIGRQAAWVVASVLIGAGAATTILWKPKPSPAVAVTRFAITLSQGQHLAVPRQAIAISPDGSRIVYAAEDKLFVRTMSELEPRAIPGADRAWHPVFSPDGQSLLFWADSVLKTVPVGGGTAVTICQADSAPLGIAWGNDGILFAQAGAGILRVPPNGGKPEVLVAMNSSEGIAYGPQLLPDGVTLLFTIVRRRNFSTSDPRDKAQIVVQSLKTGERKTLVDGGSDARFVPTGHIVYASRGTLVAMPFDGAKFAVSASPVPVVEGVSTATGPVGSSQFAFSKSGSLVYVPGPIYGGQDLFLFDRKGDAEALKLPPGLYAYPRVSPDGKRVAFEATDGKETNISIYDLSGTSSLRRLTFGGNNRSPIWSSDGQRVVFQSDRERDPAVFWQAADGGTADRLTRPDPGTSHVPESWSPSGDAFLFSVAKGSEISLWTFSMRDRKATMFDDVRSTGYPTDAVFSPDGRWVAYQTSESGQGEGTTYVQPFPPSDTKYQIARGGRPQWSRDGSELFYTPAPDLFMAVTVTTRPTFTFTTPRRVPRGFGIADPANPRPYDITPDGRILGVGMAGQGQSGVPGTPPIQVVVNWFEELKARVPIK